MTPQDFLIFAKNLPSNVSKVHFDAEGNIASFELVGAVKATPAKADDDLPQRKSDIQGLYYKPLAHEIA